MLTVQQNIDLLSAQYLLQSHLPQSPTFPSAEPVTKSQDRTPNPATSEILFSPNT
jgi:hypothetical protein